MPDITSIFARTIYNSRGSKTIETDVTVQGGYTGRVCAPSGASVGKYEAVAFPDGGPEKCVQILADNTSKFSGVDAANADLQFLAVLQKRLVKWNNLFHSLHASCAPATVTFFDSLLILL